MVFPTLVGMSRGTRRILSGTHSFPHARGDVPGCGAEFVNDLAFSPRSWGCSGVLRVLPERHGVSLTPVGMFRMCAGRGINRVAPVDTVALVQVMARPWGLVVHGGHHRLTSICQWR